MTPERAEALKAEIRILLKDWYMAETAIIGEVMWGQGAKDELNKVNAKLTRRLKLFKMTAEECEITREKA